MTKFEEELNNKVPSDKEFQKLLEQNAELTRENNVVNQINSKLEYQIANLKSQLQQQALPVVPEYVAEWYESHGESSESLEFYIYLFCGKFYSSRDSRKNRELTNFEKWFGEDKNKPIETLIRMQEGYTVEKPQLFYLKHIDMSKNDEQVDWYMSKAHRRVGHNSCEKRKLPIYDSFKFTQQEIDSMNTGSYEHIEVEK